jgi:hypothetical protein
MFLIVIVFKYKMTSSNNQLFSFLTESINENGWGYGIRRINEYVKNSPNYHAKIKQPLNH